jgi:hypothetical protein
MKILRNEKMNIDLEREEEERCSRAQRGRGRVKAGRLSCFLRGNTVLERDATARTLG